MHEILKMQQTCVRHNAYIRQTYYRGPFTVQVYARIGFKTYRMQTTIAHPETQICDDRTRSLW